ncbi:MAG: hypothetical protein LWX70_05770, partial [Sphingobacteriia bacterium]|nr:hypothetical protein [Sphingobacteriia bacterium]
MSLISTSPQHLLNIFSTSPQYPLYILYLYSSYLTRVYRERIGRGIRGEQEGNSRRRQEELEYSGFDFAQPPGRYLSGVEGFAQPPGRYLSGVEGFAQP